MNPDLINALEKFTFPFKREPETEAVVDSNGDPICLVFASETIRKIAEVRGDQKIIGNEIARHLNDLATQAKEGM